MVVQHNISAMNANRYYGINNKALAGSLEKLSSGYAINRAGDNAAGLAVSEKMRAQIGGLTQASKNAEDGISMVQTFEGALQETDSILQRMRTLAVQSANGNYQNEVDRDAIQLEFDQLNDELNQIADTDFNGVVMLNGGVMADGTVANDTSKVADRPKLEDVPTAPDAAFTYKSIVNGTVDSAGNGSLSINGSNLKLTGGKGTASLGNLTQYTTDSSKNANASAIQVTQSQGSTPKANGTIAAKETFKIDGKTTNIEIHGNNYSLSGDVLKDADGKETTVIDGLNVTVNQGQSVVLEGSYQVDDNTVKTNDYFTDTKLSGVINDEKTGTVNVNDVQINVVEGATPTDAVSKDGVVSYNATIADGTNQGIKVTVNATGTYTKEDEVTTGTATIDKVGTKYRNAASGDYTSGDVFKIDLGGNKTIYGIKNADGDNEFYSAATITENGEVTLLEANKIDDITASMYNHTDATDSTVKLDVTEPTKKLGDADFSLSYAATTKVINANGGKDKVTLSCDGNKIYDKGSLQTDTYEKTLSNGLKLKASGEVTGQFEIDDKMTSSDTVGSFKISQGVSTSDAYNHGSRNLTFADSMTLQVGARSKDAVDFNFSYTTNGIGTLKADMNASARGLGTDQLSVKSAEEANYAIDQIDNAINKTNMIRATFGAVQNRLEHKINTLDTNNENLTAAESRIRDTQMDKEMMKFTSSQILSQASQSMLAQANSLPQGVLQLLG